LPLIEKLNGDRIGMFLNAAPSQIKMVCIPALM
jgi:hypothetical protein